jgi:hypothetical protein
MKKNNILLTLFAIICTSLFSQTPYISKVFEFCPAPGQFVNKLPEYVEGDTHETMIAKVEETIVGNTQGLISLGAYGGYVVFGFDHEVKNIPGKYDLKIWGNAYYSNSTPGQETGSCEPGIVMVSYDANGNGIPDDPWYELAGSEYGKPETIKNYEITYYKPDPDKEPTPHPTFPFLTDTSYVKWTSNQGDFGYVAKNSSHTQSYYPQWMSEETLVFEGTKLANNGVDLSGAGIIFTQRPYSYGYVDNHPNNNIRACLDIDWAVDAQGHKANLPGIHFVKVYTGVNQYCGLWGETSTEIMGAEDFHIQGIEIDVLGVQPDAFPDAKIYFHQGKLYLENLEDCYGTLYNINGQVMDSFFISFASEIININSISVVYLKKKKKQNAVRIFKFVVNH